ncbi:membrane protein DedA with SNARE-associated domain [Brevibacterium sanguinis]|uniref:Membrane protein DedA with SNARE-associated domain n=3 Tax=Brevibacteriaceae TaxID=85019 RepID=A0A366IJ81_9MICO|nr:membrane protein DedA with SNARE-associated domain [Brevibacterium sanguinis]RBP70770.1 membrane protein DedA with SNARE-associated domain [Brevibacterium celere]
MPELAASATRASSAADQLNGFSAWAVTVMETLGPIGVGFLVFLDNIFPPIPSELVLPLAGFTASRGEMSLLLAIVFATIGSLTGALLLWALGRWIGLERISRIALKVPLVDVDDITKTVAWFDRHGGKAVFFGRMIPIFRSLISIPAGMRDMPLVRFVLLTTAGSTIWNTIFVVAGFWLGENWAIVESYAGVFQKLVIVAVLVFIVVWVVLKVRKHRRRSAGPGTGDDAAEGLGEGGFSSDEGGVEGRDDGRAGPRDGRGRDPREG